MTPPNDTMTTAPALDLSDLGTDEQLAPEPAPLPALPAEVDRRLKDEARFKVLRKRYRRRPWDVPRELLMDSLERNDGHLGRVAEDMDVSFTMLVSWVDSDPQLQAFTMQLREVLVHDAEQVLHSHLKQGSLQAAQFTLSTLGRNKGYVKRSESLSHSTVVHEKPAVDLRALSTDQLRQLRSIARAAQSGGEGTSDAEYEEVSGGEGE